VAQNRLHGAGRDAGLFSDFAHAISSRRSTAWARSPATNVIVKSFKQAILPTLRHAIAVGLHSIITAQTETLRLD
jgi:hypothetical protein